MIPDRIWPSSGCLERIAILPALGIDISATVREETDCGLHRHILHPSPPPPTPPLPPPPLLSPPLHQLHRFLLSLSFCVPSTNSPASSSLSSSASPPPIPPPPPPFFCIPFTNSPASSSPSSSASPSPTPPLPPLCCVAFSWRGEITKNTE